MSGKRRLITRGNSVCLCLQSPSQTVAFSVDSWGGLSTSISYFSSLELYLKVSEGSWVRLLFTFPHLIPSGWQLSWFPNWLFQLQPCNRAQGDSKKCWGDWPGEQGEIGWVLGHEISYPIGMPVTAMMPGLDRACHPHTAVRTNRLCGSAF